MSITIVGNLGSQGKRFSHVLDCLNVPYTGSDLNCSIDKSDQYIITTSTDSHFLILKRIYEISPQARILCEKPISKNLEEVIEAVRLFGNNLTMVYNWAMLSSCICPIYDYEKIKYDYFKTGNDGLKWDLIQPIGFSKNLVAKNESPIFKCEIDGRDYSQIDFDRSYIKMIAYFMAKKEIVQPDLINWHMKAERWTN